jgi:putative Mg2+ transporter-C (MgtC) family protein
MELITLEAVYRIFWAVLLGGIVGLEREFTQKSAGLRTHILVCMGAAIFTVISISDMTTNMALAELGSNVQVHINRDPSRIAAQVVSGIGFIGGGAVLRYGSSVRGITTAASLWLMAGIGMLAGLGYYTLSLVTTLLCFLVLFIVGRLERSLFQKQLKTLDRLRILITVESRHAGDVEGWVEKHFSSEIIEVNSSTSPEAEITTLTYILSVGGRRLNLNRWAHNIERLDGVLSTSIRLFEEDAG